ncbi:MAG TPA: FtsX-like permease family protein [Thermoanaerobaculia bacterium]|nr:FtsX-like permease family protein [Thermoanaerobaculia bacterium]
MTALTRKLLRDLWGIRSQALAISLVMASGIALFVMSRGNFSSLRLTQQTYYRDYHFAEVFANAKRVPQRREEEIREIPGVRQVQTRTVADVVLDVPGMEQPARGRLISLPDSGERPELNDLALRSGRWIDPARPEEVLANQAFVAAHGFEPGDQVTAVINGRRKALVIVGVVMSPEYVYTIGAGELFPDPRRFGILWMARRPLASAFDMEGGFNDVALTLDPGTQPEAVIAELDRLLAPFGGVGAIPRALQLSHWYLEGELGQLQNMALIIPTIFLGVAAFLLNVVLRRIVAVQREQIAQLKALGYDNRALALHYLQWSASIAGLGALIGVALGTWLSVQMLDMYMAYFEFPQLEYDFSWANVLGALAFAAGAAAIGAVGAVRGAVALPPAEAMRPQPPAHYQRTVAERLFGTAWLSQPSRIILRNLSRARVRTALSILGIAFSGAIMVVGSAMMDSIDEILRLQFDVAQRQDVTVTFFEPASPAAYHELQRYPGVLEVEPMRATPARLRAGPRSRQVGITGLPAHAELYRVVDADGRPITPPPEGVLLSSVLADRLAVRPGDPLEVAVLEGRRPVVDTVVAGTVDDFVGTAAYMEIGALRRLLREGDVLSGVTLAIDSSQEQRLLERLKETPMVAGVGLKQAVIDNFETYLADNMNAFLFAQLAFAMVIAFGVIYNTARISLSERNRELASLRVMGFRRAEIAYILLGELALLTLLSLPLGIALGYGLLAAAVNAFETELYRIPLVMSSRALLVAISTVLASASISALVVRRKLDTLDLVAVLKTRE